MTELYRKLKRTFPGLAMARRWRELMRQAAKLMLAGTDRRQCCVCHEYLPTSMFRPRRKGGSLLNSRCRFCTALALRDYRRRRPSGLRWTKTGSVRV